MMCNCIIQNCQYENFFNCEEFITNKSLYYVKDDGSKDTYCLFHAPKELKEKFTYYNNELFKQTVLEYINFSKQNKQTIDFSQSIFHLPFEVNGLKEVATIDFTNTIFLKYFRMDNLECNKVIFKDTEFHEGGGIKNRLKEKEVYIDKLVFRPYQLESDFVIDIGKYANNKGLIESNIYGVIKHIKFENHKKGKGIVYFIGLNGYIEEADFRNMILDNVSFQNCDLDKCYFLNAKVDETEFRNCEFPQIKQGFTLNIVDKNMSHDIVSVFVGLFIIVLLYLAGAGLLENVFEFLDIQVDQNVKNTFFKLLQVTYPLLPIIIIAFLVPVFKTIYSFEALMSIMVPENKFQQINKIKTIHYHKGIADENKIDSKLGFTVPDSQKEVMQETLSSIEAIYRQLKINFSKKDFQFSGDFFFSQRLMEVYASKYKDNLVERSILIIHHGLNGFGEKFIKPAIFFIATIFIFGTLYTPNIDFVATDQVPQFLTIETTTNKNIPSYKKTIFYTEKNETKIREYRPELLSSDRSTSFVYSANQFISPFTVKNRAWFKTVSSKAAILNVIETVLLYIFFGAFILALKNRIKR